MEHFLEILTSWYPLIFILSVGVALIVWIWAIKKKTRHDIRQAAELVLNRRYRNGDISKDELERRLQSLAKRNLNE